jgi:hypothetical protein
MFVIRVVLSRDTLAKAESSLLRKLGRRNKKSFVKQEYLKRACKFVKVQLFPNKDLYELQKCSEKWK